MLISSLYAANVHQDLLNTDSKTSKNNTTSDVNKEKKYRVKDDRWYCNHCDIFCNSDSQYQVHLMSSKHKTAKSASEDGNNIKITYTINIKENEIARESNVDATRYYIPLDKRNGKYQKFGFYCDKCDVYMTGQIQLIMHVKGLKHQFLSPNEIPGYAPTKAYDPNKFKKRFFMHNKENIQRPMHTFSVQNLVFSNENRQSNDRTHATINQTSNNTFNYQQQPFNTTNGATGIQPILMSSVNHCSNLSVSSMSRIDRNFYPSHNYTTPTPQQQFTTPTTPAIKRDTNRLPNLYDTRYVYSTIPSYYTPYTGCYSNASMPSCTQISAAFTTDINKDKLFNHKSIHHHHQQQQQPFMHNNRQIIKNDILGMPQTPVTTAATVISIKDFNHAMLTSQPQPVYYHQPYSMTNGTPTTAQVFYPNQKTTWLNGNEQSQNGF